MSPRREARIIWFLRIITPSLMTGLIVLCFNIYGRIDAIWVKVNSQEIVNESVKGKFVDLDKRIDLKADKSEVSAMYRLLK